MTDADRLKRLHEHLAATAERPVEREASRWLGEAEALAEDLVVGDPDPSVRRERIAEIDDLLDHVAGTGDEVADGHVETARALVESLLD